MHKNIPTKLTIAALLAFFLLPQLFIAPGCANMVPPVGGPKDTLPPNLVRVRPADSSRNFDSKKIVFEFDEFVQVDRIAENLLISPTPKNNPIVTYKLHNVTVAIKDSLEPNTTYVFNFGNAIRDVNESNILKEFSYVFSTGNRIDSLAYGGHVLLAQTGKPDSTLIAGLYTSGDDSAVYKEKPRYIARVNKEGYFRFRFLPPGTYYLYAFKDEGGSKKYLSKTQLFAFADAPIQVGAEAGNDTLYAYAEQEETRKTAATAAKPPRGQQKTVEPLRLETSLENNELDLLKPFELYFRQAPIKTFDTSLVRLTDEKFNPLDNYQILRDTGNSKLTLQYAWKENTAYALLVDKDFVADTANRKLAQSDTLRFRTRKESAYGGLRLRFLNLDLSRNPVLQMVQSDQIKFSYPFTSSQFNAKLLIPGEYDLRILYDSNKNGVWDPGSFFGSRKQPEQVQPIKRKITVKANWDQQIDIEL